MWYSHMEQDLMLAFLYNLRSAHEAFNTYSNVASLSGPPSALTHLE